MTELLKTPDEQPEEPQKEIIDLRLSPRSASGESGAGTRLLEDLKQQLPWLFSDAAASGCTWLRGKSLQEVARAGAILSSAIKRIGELELADREAVHRQELERAELRLQALERITKVVKDWQDMGIEVNIRLVAGLVASVVGKADSVKLLKSPGSSEPSTK